jgi:hypothetical protein
MWKKYCENRKKNGSKYQSPDLRIQREHINPFQRRTRVKLTRANSEFLPCTQI